MNNFDPRLVGTLQQQANAFGLPSGLNDDQIRQFIAEELEAEAAGVSN